MPDQIDDLLRNSLEEAPAATPPPGQWEKIRKREFSHKAAKPRRNGWLLLAGIFFGFAAGGPAGWWLAADNCGARTQDAMEVKIAGYTYDNEPAPDTNASPTANRPAVSASVAESQQKEALPAERREMAAKSPAPKNIPGTRVPAQKAVPAPTPLSDILRIDSVKKVPISSGNPTYAIESIARTSVVVLPETRSRRNMLFQLNTYGLNAGIAPPKMPDFRPKDKGLWEAGAHFTPRFSIGNKSISTFTAIDNGNSTTVLEFEGQEYRLFNNGSITPDLPQKPGVDIVSMEIGRQFYNGLRVGLGLAWQPKHSSVSSKGIEVIHNQLLENEWAKYRYFEEETLLLSLSAGYTFRRHKRLQPYLGFFLGSRFYNETSYKEITYRRLDRSSSINYSYTIRNSENFGDLFLFGQVGLHYLIGEHFSVGLEIVPGIGIGGRYRF